MEYIIDRIVENTAFCEKEDGTIREILISLLPHNIKEGDILIENNGLYKIDKQKTLYRKNEVENILKNFKNMKK